MSHRERQEVYNVLMSLFHGEIGQARLEQAADLIIDALRGPTEPREEPVAPPASAWVTLTRLLDEEPTPGVSIRTLIVQQGEAETWEFADEHGIRLLTVGARKRIAIAKTHPARDRVFGDDLEWRSAIRSLPGVIPGDGREDFGSRRSRYLLAPIEFLDR